MYDFFNRPHLAVHQYIGTKIFNPFTYSCLFQLEFTTRILCILYKDAASAEDGKSDEEEKPKDIPKEKRMKLITFTKYFKNK